MTSVVQYPYSALPAELMSQVGFADVCKLYFLSGSPSKVAYTTAMVSHILSSIIFMIILSNDQA